MNFKMQYNVSICFPNLNERHDVTNGARYAISTDQIFKTVVLYRYIKPSKFVDAPFRKYQF